MMLVRKIRQRAGRPVEGDDVVEHGLHEVAERLLYRRRQRRSTAFDRNDIDVEVETIEQRKRVVEDLFHRFENGPLRELLALLGREAAIEAMAIAVEGRISLRGNPGAEVGQIGSVDRCG